MRESVRSVQDKAEDALAEDLNRRGAVPNKRFPNGAMEMARFRLLQDAFQFHEADEHPLSTLRAPLLQRFRH